MRDMKSDHVQPRVKPATHLNTYLQNAVNPHYVPVAPHASWCEIDAEEHGGVVLSLNGLFG